MVRNIIVCGGGSGGHVLPALTVMRKVLERDPSVKVLTVGSYKGIEADLFQKEGLPYKAISTGKLRRYFSWQNFTDLFRIIWGTLQSFFYAFKFKNNETVVFCTGGFVTVPLAFACWLQGKTVVVHEQTSRVGLANKICSTFAKKVIITFDASKEYFPQDKTIELGYPLREEIFKVKPLRKRGGRPVLFLTGGGNGSSLLNKVLLQLKEKLKDEFTIIHQCGKLEFEKYRIHQNEHYEVYDFVNEEMVSLLDQADIVISRAGAGTVIELMALGKPSIFVPLKIAQKNEQFHNAMEANRKLGSIVIKEDDFNVESLEDAIRQIQDLKRGETTKSNPTEAIVDLLLKGSL